ncbi:cytosine/adenosine deaminase-related metal-dependent hydrolase [Variovorax boronicumulans]|uniref:amidohydrolase family protein n=1 Tax=Variovorax boronicumulans TaxID=436515 RepID=UPI002783790E|nr:amidohydrolase family protein [Variovorax boronicumulans]MDP9908619.1 cytosine/adenosine deaminase-related metal-dependent hydrolase [Variovorax boronicumulans]
MTPPKIAPAPGSAPPAGLTRKAFLGLSASAAAAAAFAPQAMAQTPKPAASPRGPVRRTLIRGADLLTMDPQNKELQATDVLVENGRIAAIGKRLPAGDAEVIEARGMILMPGMIDGHRHMWHGLDAGRIVKAEPNAYAKGYIGWQRRTMACMTPEDNYLAELIGGLQAIDAGVTTVLDYAHGQPTEEKALAAARGVKDSGVAGWFTFQLGRATAFGPGSTISTARVHADLNTTTETNWKTVERLQKELFSDSNGLLQLGLAPSNATGRPLAEVRREWERARATGVKMLAAHVHKTAQPQPAGTIGHRGSGIVDLHEAGLLGPDYHASHGNRLTDDELKMLRDTGGMLCATVVGEFPYMMTPHLMASAHGRARHAGVATGIGIDVNSVLQQDYFEHVRCAFLSLFLEPEGREIVRDYKSEDTLDFATALGAKAVRLGDVTGSLTVGKRADLVLLRTDRIGFAMLGSLADRVMNFASQADIDSVWVAGTARKRHGKMLGVDWAKLKAQQVAAQQRIGPQQASITFTT